MDAQKEIREILQGLLPDANKADIEQFATVLSRISTDKLAHRWAEYQINTESGINKLANSLKNKDIPMGNSLISFEQARVGSVSIGDVAAGDINNVSINISVIPRDPSHNSPPTKARNLIIKVLEQTYRRAFSLNFQTRFTDQEDFQRVYKSIRSCRINIQKKMVRVQAECPNDISSIIYNILQELEYLEASFERLRNVFDRLDPHGHPNTIRSFIDVEKSRLSLLAHITRLASAANLPLPKVPITEVLNGIPFGASELLPVDDWSVQNLEKAAREFEKIKLRQIDEG
jgi:hypothetical protein